MDAYKRCFISKASKSEQDMDVRKGPWTEEEDSMLKAYVNIHGEGRWNSVALLSGLRRTGKSCRLRWLNYMRPEIKRGNISLQEQLFILQLHTRWGNRWSKIAQHLPGRTDNEIKNYWRTRVQKHAKHLKCDVSSKQFKDAMRYVWIPRLVERIHASSHSPSSQPFTNGYGSSLLPESSSDTSISELTDCNNPQSVCPNNLQNGSGTWGGVEFQTTEEHSHGWFGGYEECSMETVWNEENIWFLQQQLHDDGV